MMQYMNRVHRLRELSADELLELQRLRRTEKTRAAVSRRARLVWLPAGVRR